MRATGALALFLLLFTPLLGCSSDDDPSGPSNNDPDPTGPVGSMAFEIRDPDDSITSFGIVDALVTATHATEPAKAPRTLVIALRDETLPVTDTLEDLEIGDWVVEIIYRDGAGAQVADNDIGIPVRENEATILDNVLVADGVDLSAEFRTRVSGFVHFDGRPLSETTSTNAIISVIDRDGGGQVPERSLEYDTATGRFTISNIPFAEVSFNLFVRETGGNANLPGNFVGYAVSNLRTDSTIDREAVVLHVARTIHLTSPIDIGTDLGATGEYFTHSSPVTFQWDAIPEATRYTYSLDQYDTVPSFSRVGGVLNDETTDSSVELALDTLPEDNIYLIHLYAYDDNVLVGVLRSVYTNGVGSDYRFHVK